LKSKFYSLSSAQSMQINFWHRPHIALQHLRQVSMVLLFLQPFRTAQLRRFRETLHPGPALGRSTWRRRSISGLMRSSASVCMKSHRLIFLPVSLLKSIQAFTPARSRMLHQTAIGQRRIGDLVECILAIESSRSTPHLFLL